MTEITIIGESVTSANGSRTTGGRDTVLGEAEAFDAKVRRRIDRYSVPQALESGASWAWRFLVVAAAGTALLWLLARLRVVLIPVFVAVILTALLAPLVALLTRWVPRLLATWIAVLGVVGSISGLVYLLQAPVVSAVEDLRMQWDDAFLDVRTWLSDGPLGLDSAKVDETLTAIGARVESLASGLFDEPASTAMMAAEVATGVLLTLVLTFFFLKDAPSMWPWLLDRVHPVRRPTLDRAARAAFSALQGWIRAVAITGFVDGFLIGIALWFLGVPAALPIAVITFFASFFPIVGATAAGALACAVALTSQGVGTAVAVAVVVLVIQQVEGDVLLPMVMYRQVSLHPVVVLLALAVGGAVAGIVGAIVSVPVMAALSAAVGAARACREEQLLADQLIHEPG